MNCKYPDIHVQLSSRDGNAFAVIGAVAKAMRAAGISQEEISAFEEEAMSGDYNHLLQTAMATVDVS